MANMGNKSTPTNEINHIKINNKIIDFSAPQIMGILNLTPDSFFDGGKYTNYDNLLKKTEEMILQGADIIDVGAVSTKPGADNVSMEVELKRIIEPIKLLREAFPNTIFSVDTYRAEVATKSVAAGAHIINDISGGSLDKNMFKTIANLKVPYILMHMEGTPQTMQNKPITQNISDIVVGFFQTAITKLRELGIEDIILDPGFGFGKSVECNYSLLKNMAEVRVDNLPIMVGISRKSMINKVLNITPDNALVGTTVLNVIALLNGANILRVHDIVEAKEAIKLVEFMKSSHCY